MGHGIDVDVVGNDFLDDDSAGEAVALLQVDGPNKCLESIAVDGFEYALGFAVVLDEL